VTSFYYEFISGYTRAKIIKIGLELAIIDSSLLPLFMGHRVSVL